MSWEGWGLFQINIYFFKVLSPNAGPGRSWPSGGRGAAEPCLPVYAQSESHPGPSARPAGRSVMGRDGERPMSVSAPSCLNPRGVMFTNR